ncbi:MAG TPA: CaiB/BaiF CoA-transferase family protein [Dehalococcoidia bacterium]|nr:CaiB/BaiF CoA-transferase family protein [Dehalococcoidia bacterium]
MTSPLPLDGLRVIAFEQAVAAPLCSRHLADLGADVIKVERRGEGDFARAYDSVIHGTSTWFAWLNRGKRSLTLDMKHPKGIEVAEKLVAGADVLVQNFAPGAFDRLGLGVEQLRQRHPRLIVASITGYGEDGPYRDRKAYDLLLQAETGVVSVTGTPEEPSKAGVSVVDLSAGVYAFGSIMTALYRRERTGEGAAIRVSLFDAIMEWMSPLSLMATYGPHPKRAAARHASIVPYGPYRVAGGRQVVFAIQNEREWQRLCSDVLLRPGLATDPQFVNNEARLQNRNLLEAQIEELLADCSVEEAEERLENASIAYSRLNDVAEVLSHPQVLARDRLLGISVPGGSVDLLRAPFNIDGVEERAAAVPAVGQHTDAVLRELGYDDDAISDLRIEGAV